MKLLNILIVIVLINLSFSAFADWGTEIPDFTDSELGCINCLDAQ